MLPDGGLFRYFLPDALPLESDADGDVCVKVTAIAEAIILMLEVIMIV